MTMYPCNTVLHVDLNSGKIWRKELDETTIANFLGGRGVAAKLLWNAIQKDIDPLGEENILIFAPGALTGTHAPSSGRMTVTAKGPATNLYLKTNVGGHFGVALKMAGWDYIVVHDIADRPVYLWIDGPEVVLKDAAHLWGKGVKETTRILQKEYSGAEVACIGPAGENLTKFASIMVSYYNAAARGGIGTVMGSKRLKAIAVDGRKGKVEVAVPHKFDEVVTEAREALYADSAAADLHLYGTARDVDLLSKMRILPSYNFKRSYIEGAENLSGRTWAKEGYLKRILGCGACNFSCHRFTSVDIGKYAGTYSGGPEYETVSSLGSGCGITRVEAVLRANELCNDLGMDVISTGGVVQWAMETYEKGLLTKEDMDGIELTWGNEEVLIELIRKIAFRQGIGDLLAEGTKVASEKTGGESWKWAVQARGLEQSRVEIRGAYSYALAFAVNPRGPDHLHTECLAEFGGTPEAVNVIKRITGDERYARPDMPDKRAEIVKWHEDIYAVTDALGLCAFTTTAAYGIDEEKAAELFQYATGIDMSIEEIMAAGERILTLERCFNIREGLTRKDDKLPWRIMNECQKDLHGKMEKPIITQEQLDIWLDDYYELHGWDERGMPKKKTLDALNLSFALPQLSDAYSKCCPGKENVT
ncbi:MAG: aldehyde ferredoxin oxidoreductase family protein [Candidatus Hadarchaeota archaeon]|nr:aldehyde ferredoxin oxidoreductase family protein [Candidatus Hadarchaeota archaeon]